MSTKEGTYGGMNEKRDECVGSLRGVRAMWNSLNAKYVNPHPPTTTSRASENRCDKNKPLSNTNLACIIVLDGNCAAAKVHQAK